jgi:hypothetical protein|tara:strand:+ start:7932 stop:8537 length:606 start_codon:yes stop_codon:yes gene_type:complete
MDIQQDLLAVKWTEIKSQSDSPVVRWSVLAIAVIVIWVWVVEPLQIWTTDLQAQVARNADKATRLLALEKNVDHWLTAQQEARLALADAKQAMFVSSSNTQSQASIQSLLLALAESRNLNLESRKLIEAEVLPPIGTRLGIEVGLRGELVDLLHFMDDVSRNEKLFVIDRWLIQMERNKKAYARFTLAGLRPGVIEVQPDG